MIIFIQIKFKCTKDIRNHIILNYFLGFVSKKKNGLNIKIMKFKIHGIIQLYIALHWNVTHNSLN